MSPLLVWSLLTAGAAAVPIVIHSLRRTPRRTVALGTTRFLPSDVPVHRSPARPSRIPLLALRIALVVLLGAHIALPNLNRPDAGRNRMNVATSATDGTEPTFERPTAAEETRMAHPTVPSSAAAPIRVAIRSHPGSTADDSWIRMGLAALREARATWRPLVVTNSPPTDLTFVLGAPPEPLIEPRAAAGVTVFIGTNAPASESRHAAGPTPVPPGQPAPGRLVWPTPIDPTVDPAIVSDAFPGRLAVWIDHAATPGPLVNPDQTQGRFPSPPTLWWLAAPVALLWWLERRNAEA